MPESKPPITIENAHKLVDKIFLTILPQHSYKIREEQVSLAHHVLDTIANGETTLAEAEVGTGKTLAYLIPAIIARRGKLNEFKNTALYPGMPYAHMLKMPIALATSSIALQRALLTDYIPKLSRILMASGIIKKPLKAVLRKGKEHYVCERNLRNYLQFEKTATTRRSLTKLLPPSDNIDLADTDLAPYVKRKVCVSGRCADFCPHYDECKYLEFREEAASYGIDIQVTNHNYLLADTLLRSNNSQALLPNYQVLIIDEAHKFLSAAQSMYGQQLSDLSSSAILETVKRMTFKREGFQALVGESAKKLTSESKKLFGSFLKIIGNIGDDETNRFTAKMDDKAVKHLRNIQGICERLLFCLRDEALYTKATELLAWINKKHRFNISAISLKQILTPTYDRCDSREEQFDRMRPMINRLHQAVAALPQIKDKVLLEQAKQRERYFTYRTERQVLINNQSKISDHIGQYINNFLPTEKATSEDTERISKLMWEIEQLRNQAAAFIQYADLITWLEIDERENKLCAIPKNLNERLFSAQWYNGIPTLLTSGTLSAAGDFSHTKRTLGLDLIDKRLTETSKPSPFNHRENALLYISETTPFPNNKNTSYISAIADEVERLIQAAHGHTAVLFTSYDVMGRVHALLKAKNLSYPLFRLDKGGALELERFKKSDSGVLFASGSLWEGIDIPGDALSLLIIVKLPFQVPDPISEYEETQYKDLAEYKKCVVVPEMLIKLKQGFGRLIRTETDTGVVAILDNRANRNGAYRRRVLAALPGCRATSKISDVEKFIKAKKTLDYFL